MSVGVDSNLCVNDTTTRTLTKYPPIPLGTNAVVTTKSTGINKKRIALKYENRVEVWNLGQAVQPERNHIKEVPKLPTRTNTYLPLREDAEKLLTLYSKEGCSIQSFDMASDGSAVAYATSDGSVRIFELSICETREESGKTQAPKIRRICFKKPNDNYGNKTENGRYYNIVKFLPPPSIAKGATLPNGGLPVTEEEKSKKLLLSTVGGSLQCFNLPEEDEEDNFRESTVKATAIHMWTLLPRQDLDLTSGISHISVHPNGHACAVADFQGNIRLLDCSNAVSSTTDQDIRAILRNRIRKVPYYDSAPVSCMDFDPTQSATGNLVIVYANHHFVEADVGSGKYTKFTNEVASAGKKCRQLPREFEEKQFATRGVIFANNCHQIGDDNFAEPTGTSVIFYDESHICSLNKNVWLQNVTKARSALKEILQSGPASHKAAKRNKGMSSIR